MDKEQLQAKLTEIFELKFKDNFKSEFKETSGFKKVNVCYLHDFFEAGCEARQLEIDLLQDEVEQSKLAYESLHDDYIQAIQEVRIAHENHSESVESLQQQLSANTVSVDEIKSAIEDYYKALNNREHGRVALCIAMSSIEEILGISWDKYNKKNMLGNYAILAKEASNVSNS